MGTGWVKLHRQIKNHWIWNSDNRLKWWIDILLTVNHIENKVLIKGTLIDCNKGQSVRSLDSWAKDWNVTKKTVSDFFKLLQKENMILIENLKITTRITVCNYDVYNDLVNATETPSKRQVNATETPSKRELHTNKNIKNEKNEKNEKNNILVEFEFSDFCKNLESEIIEFLNFRKELKKPLKTKIGFKSWQKELEELSNKNIETAKEILKKSIANGWQGIFKLKSSHSLTDEYQAKKTMFSVNNDIQKDPNRLKW